MESHTEGQSRPRGRPVPRALDRQMAQVFAPLRGAGRMPAGWRLLQVEVDHGINLLLRGPHSLLSVELDRRDTERPCFQRTALFNVHYSEVHGARGPLGDPERRVLEAVLDCLRAGEAGLRSGLDRASQSVPVRSQLREIQVDRMLMRDEQAAWYLNPYVGCTLGCTFCFASHRGAWSRALQGEPDLPWGTWLDVKVNAAQVLAREVQRPLTGVVRMSPIITDPYLGAERKYRITRQCLEVLAGTDLQPMVLTRSPLVLRDLDVLGRCSQPRVGFSVPTEDDAVRRAVEPHAPPIADRIQALAELKSRGFQTFAMVRPILLRDARALADLLAPVATVVEIGPLQEKPRVEAQLRAVGHEAPLDDAWQREQFLELERHLTARGVRVNPREPPWCST